MKLFQLIEFSQTSIWVYELAVFRKNNFQVLKYINFDKPTL